MKKYSVKVTASIRFIYDDIEAEDHIKARDKAVAIAQKELAGMNHDDLEIDWEGREMFGESTTV